MVRTSAGRHNRHPSYLFRRGRLRILRKRGRVPNPSITFLTGAEVRRRQISRILSNMEKVFGADFRFVWSFKHAARFCLFPRFLPCCTTFGILQWCVRMLAVGMVHLREECAETLLRSSPSLHGADEAHADRQAVRSAHDELKLFA